MQRTLPFRSACRGGAVVGVAFAVAAASVLAGGSAALAAGGDTTITQVNQDFTAGAASIVLDADIDDATSRSTTLTLAPNTGPTARTVLDLHGHTLAVQAVQLTTFQNGSPVGAALRVVDSAGGGVLRVVQTGASSPAVEVDSGASLEVLSGTVDATGASGSTAAVIGGGTAASALQASGSITANASGRIVATGSGSGAAVGAGDGAGAGAITFGGSSSVTATNSGTGAAIGDGNGVSSASITIANQAQVAAYQYGTGSTGAAIGGGASPTGQTAGAVTIGDSAQVTAVSTGAGAAIGGGYHGDGGSISATGYSHVTATGAEAAIGDGEFATGGGSNIVFSGQGVVVDAHGGTGSAGGAGIGGGSTAYGNDSLSIGNGATVSATSDHGPGIGGLGNRYSMSVGIDTATVTARGAGTGAAAIGAGSTASIGASLSTGSGTTLTTSNTDGTVIGGSTASRFGSFTNGGTLNLPSGDSLVVPVGASASNSGVIANSGAVVGAGTISNDGSIVNTTGGTVSGTVTGNDYRIVYDAQTGTGSTTQYVYAPTVTAADLTVPSATPPTTGRFTSWNSSTDGTGVSISATRALSDIQASDVNASGQATLRLYALYQLNPVLPGSGAVAQAVVGTAYSASVAVTAGTAPISYDATGIPAGLSFSGGVISGTPTTAGSFTIRISAENGAGSASGVYTIEVVPTPIALSVPSTASGSKRYLAGATANLRIANLQANETYAVTIGGRSVASGKASSSSPFTLRVTIPRSIGDGSQTVQVTGGIHATAASATILTASVAKSLGLKLSARSVKHGKRIVVTVSKLYSGESVRVVISGKHGKVSVGTATSKGGYVLTLRSGLAKGRYTVTVTGAGTSRKASAKLTVS